MDRGHRPRSRCKRLRRRSAWSWTRQGGVDRLADLGGRGQGRLAGTLCGGRIEGIAEAAAVAGNALVADACLALAAGAPPLSAAFVDLNYEDVDVDPALALDLAAPDQRPVGAVLSGSSPTADPVRCAAPYLSVGMTNSAPARMPLGHREVMYFALV